MLSENPGGFHEGNETQLVQAPMTPLVLLSSAACGMQPMMTFLTLCRGRRGLSCKGQTGSALMLFLRVETQLLDNLVM